MERRLSVGIAAAGLLAALGIFVLGRRSSSDDLRTSVVDLEALIRETAAGTQARADTLAQLPRLSWAVATDENTVRDLTTEELAFRTHPGEHIEITQMRRGGGEPRRLLRLPPEGDLALPVLAGTHVFAEANHLHVVTVVNVEPHERANELVGAVAVSKQMDTSAIEQRLAARGISAEVRTIQGTAVLAGSAPGASSTSEKVALTGPAAEGTDLVAANVGRPRWPNFVSPLVLVLALVAAALIRRRGRDADDHPHQDLTPIAVAPPAPEERPRRFTSPGLGTGTGPSAATSVAGVPAKTPIAGVPAGTPVAGVPAGTPVAGLPTRTPVAVPVLPPGAVPEFKLDQALTGRVDIPLARSGSVSMSPRAPGAAAALRDPKADDDPRSEEYRSLFDEYVKLRRTTGESVEGLDAAHFVETLREKRAQIMKQVPVKDVRFKLAFQNGKAGVRYVTVS